MCLQTWAMIMRIDWMSKAYSNCSLNKVAYVPARADANKLTPARRNSALCLCVMLIAKDGPQKVAIHTCNKPEKMKMR